MRYRVSKAQVKMLLDGKSLAMGNGRKLILPNFTDIYERVSEIMADPKEADKKVFYTDGITLFVEEKNNV